MGKRESTVSVALAIICLLAVTVAYAQEPTPASALDPASIASGFYDGSFWITLLATLIAGAAGGVVYELLILQGNIELPHRLTKDEVTESPQYAVSKFMFDLGIWARILIGAFAAVAVLLVLTPTTTFGLLATAVIAGSAGTAIFRSMQDRLLAALAEKDATNTRATANSQNDKIGEIAEAFADLKSSLLKTSTSPAGGEVLVFAAPEGEPALTLNVEKLAKVERLLSEAKGIHGRF